MNIDTAKLQLEYAMETTRALLEAHPPDDDRRLALSEAYGQMEQAHMALCRVERVGA